MITTTMRSGRKRRRFPGTSSMGKLLALGARHHRTHVSSHYGSILLPRHGRKRSRAGSIPSTRRAPSPGWPPITRRQPSIRGPRCRFRRPQFSVRRELLFENAVDVLPLRSNVNARAHAHVWLMERFHFQPRQLRRTSGRSRSEKERDHETYLRNHICGRVHRRLHAGVCGGCSRRRRNCARRRHDPWTVSWSASDDGAQSAGPDSGSASGSRAATGHQWATESINRAPTDGLAAAVGWIKTYPACR